VAERSGDTAFARNAASESGVALRFPPQSKAVQGPCDTPNWLADFARQARDILSGVYRNEMKKLGDFGFDVNDSPKMKKAGKKQADGTN
jgi:hypothetical protein